MQISTKISTRNSKQPVLNGCLVKQHFLCKGLESAGFFEETTYRFMQCRRIGSYAMQVIRIIGSHAMQFKCIGVSVYMQCSSCV